MHIPILHDLLWCVVEALLLLQPSTAAYEIEYEYLDPSDSPYIASQASLTSVADVTIVGAYTSLPALDAHHRSSLLPLVPSHWIRGPTGDCSALVDTAGAIFILDDPLRNRT